MHYMQHANVLPFPSPSHGPHRATQSVLWSQPQKGYNILQKAEGQEWEAVQLGQRIFKNSSYE